MIDHSHQGKGYGRQALALVIDHARSRSVPQLLLSVVPGENSPQDFYEGAGFKLTGDLDDGELVMRLPLT